MGFHELKREFSLRTHFLCFISGLYSNSSLLSETTEARTLHLVFLYVRWLLQMLLFVQYSSQQSTPLDEWFWFLLTFTRPDSLLSNLSAAYVWFLLVCAGVLLSWSLFLLLFALQCTGRRECRVARTVLLAVTNSLVFAMTIPCSNALLTVYFENDTRFGKGFTPEIRAWGRAFAPPLYCLNMLYITIVYVGNYEFDQFQANKMCKSELVQDYMFIVLTQVTIWSYYLLAPTHYYLHLLVVGFSSFLSTYRVLTHLPFYGLAYNLMFVWSRGALGLSCCGFGVSYWLDSPLCGLVLTFTVSIGWFVWVKLWFEGHYKATVKRYWREMEENEADYQWELGIRRLFTQVYETNDADKASQLTSLLNSALVSPKRRNKVRILLLKHFLLLHVLDDERGARICLSLTSLHPSSLEDLYLTTKYEQDRSHRSRLEEMLYFRYLEELNALREKDQEVCAMLGKVWRELGSLEPDLRKVVTLAQTVKGKIRLVEDGFRKMAKIFPSSSELYEFYSEFSEQICCDLDQAKFWKAKAIACSKEKKAFKDDSVSFFDPSTCVILIDMRAECMGVIAYMNSSAGKALKYDTQSGVSSKITGVIPPPYSHFHAKCMRRFMSLGVNLDLNHPDMLPLVCSEGHLIFTNARLFLTCHHRFPLIALAFKPLQYLREGALLSQTCVIECHTAGLPLRLMDSPSYVLKGQNLAVLRPSFAEKRSIEGDSRPFSLYTNRSFIGKFAFSSFGPQRVFFFFLFVSGDFHVDAEFLNWKAQLASDNSSFCISSSRDRRRVSILEEAAVAPAYEEAANPLLAPMRTGSRLSLNASSKDNSSSDTLIRLRHLNKCESDLRSSQLHCQLTTLVLAAGFLAANTALAYLLNSQANHIYRTNEIDTVAAKQIYAGQLGFSALGIWFNYSRESRDLLVDNMNLFVGKMQQAQERIWEEIDNVESEEYEDFCLNQPIATWELLDGEVLYRERTLVNALSKLVDEVSDKQSLVLQRALNSTDLPISKVFYVYRNGRGETSIALNQAKAIYITSEVDQINDFLGYTAILQGALLLFLLVISTAVLFIALRLNAAMQNVSSLLFNYGASVYMTQLNRVMERLREKYGNEDYLTISQAARRDRPVEVLFRPVWYLVVPLALLWVFCALFYLTFHFELMADLSYQLQANPKVIDSDSSRLMNLIEIGTLTSENFFKEIGLSASLLVPTHILIPSYALTVQAAVGRMKAASTQLLYQALNGFTLNSAHYEFALKKTNFSSAVFKQGYRAGSQVLLYDTLFCLNAGMQECMSIVRDLFSTYVELATQALAISQYYRQDGEDRMAQLLATIDGLLALSSVLIVLCCLCFLLCLLPSAHRRATGLVKLVTFIKIPPNNEPQSEEGQLLP